MGFHVDRVKVHRCPHCGQQVDVAKQQPLQPYNCPACDTAFNVPARMGSMLITNLLGVGTGSMVYQATDQVLGQEVALKVMKTEETPGDAAAAQSGIDEARALLLVDHPHVVKVHAIDTRRGQPCIIMELLPGGSLKDPIDAGKPVAEAQALKVTIEIAEALRETANRGLYHLDVKPGNIMFDAGGVAKLCDFGYAAIDPDEDRKEILGTPYYVSPELIRQLPPDHRADIYSLGASLFHVLTAEAPFEDADDDIKKILLARLNAPPPDPREKKPDLNPATAQVVMRMLEEDIDDRYRTYDDLIQDLKKALDAVGG